MSKSKSEFKPKWIIYWNKAEVFVPKNMNIEFHASETSLKWALNSFATQYPNFKYVVIDAPISSTFSVRKPTECEVEKYKPLFFPETSTELH